MSLKLISYSARFFSYCLLISAVGIWIAPPAFSQQKSESSRLQDMIQSYSCASARQERLFVFLNSGFYYPGENLSFKAVLFDADMKIKADGSQFFYLQMISQSGISIGNYIYELHSGECSGQIRLPDTLLTGLYTLKAYSRWMRNYGSDNSFSRPFLVISPLNGTALQSSAWDSVPVHFYPESGNFISGVENTFLVRANPYHQPSIKQFNIADDRGKILLTCDIDTNGTGVFSLTPERGRKYYAIVADSGQPMQTYKLPDQQLNGYCMNIAMDQDMLKISVTCTRETENKEDIFLAVMTGNAERSFIRHIHMVNNRGTLFVPATDMPTGLSQIIVFGNNSVLCSRLWYRKNEQVAGQETTINDTLKTRASVTVGYDLPENVPADKIIAVSVTEHNPITDNILFNEISYCQYFDLYSSLSRPEILPLFEASASEKYINDCLMAITKTLSMDVVSAFPNNNRYSREIYGVMLTGKVIYQENRIPVSGAAVLLSYPDSIAHFMYSITNESGEFSFTLNDKLYNKQLYITVQGYPQTSNSISIIPDDLFNIPSSGVDALPLVHSSIEPVINGHKNIAMAYRVFYRTHEQPQESKNQRESTYTKNFYGDPDFTLIPSEYEFLPDIFEMRKNLIPGLKLKVEDDYCRITVFNDYLQIFYSQEAFVMLNNISFPSFKNMLELNSDNIRSIDIKRDKFFYDNYLMYGMVVINTVKPMAIEPYYSYHIAVVKVVRDCAETLLVRPINYGTLPDLRHTLYWEPNRKLRADTGGIHFTTSDVKGNYKVALFYLTADGSLRGIEKVCTVY